MSEQRLREALEAIATLSNSVVARTIAKDALAAPIAAPADEARDVYPTVRIRVDEAGKVIEATLYAPGLPAGEFNIYPVGIENCATGAVMATPAGSKP